MRAILLTATIFLSFCLSQEMQAQAKRYALLEHFTQASCAPCAIQNPAFFARFYDNQHRAHVIAYHTSWPGFDPMFEDNPGEQQAIRNYYSISSVPNTVVNGDLIGLPNQVTDQLIRNTLPTNYRVRVWEGDDPDEPENRLVQVTVESVGEPVLDELRLRVVAVEEPVIYPTPPGSNGEREFPYVFRRFVAGSTDGVLINPPAKGESSTFEYSFPIDAEWNEENILCVAYVADPSSREVLNSGVMGDPTFEIAASSQKLYKQSADTVTFDVNLIELANDTSQVFVDLDFADLPGWNAYFEYNGDTYQDGATLTVEPGVSIITLFVVTDGSPNKNTYRFNIAQVGSAIEENIEFKVISPVEDLMIFHDAEFVDPAVALDLEAVLQDGRMISEVTESVVISTSEWREGLEAGVFPNVKNIYLNTGWTFPPLTEAMIDALDNHLDAGGNLLIAGQDIGQYIMTGGAPTSFRAFFFNTLNAQLADNGDASLSEASINSADPIFGDLEDLSIARVYGTNYTRPDVLRSRNGSQPVFYYNGETDQVAALRSEEGGMQKILYLGFGLEQIGDTDALATLLTRCQEWFNGEITVSTPYDPVLSQGWTIQPNPAYDRVQIISKSTGLELSGKMYEILNAFGQRVSSGVIRNKNQVLPINELIDGIYFIRLSGDGGVSRAQSLVIHR